MSIGSSHGARGRALVTGASSGIGATYCEKLAARGYDLVLVARDAGRLKALAEKLAQQHGIDADVLRADLSDRADLDLVDRRLREDGRIDLFVNNAGIGPRGRLLKADLAYLDHMVDLNVTAANRLAVAAAQAFSARGTGKIVNIASSVALSPEVFNGTYVAGKAFVLALTESLAAELRETGVQVQAVLPGFTRTEIFERAGSSVDRLPPETVMEVGDLVDAALAGLDRGELVTIPSLEDTALLDAFQKARAVLAPYLSLKRPAARYREDAAMARAV